MRPISLALLLAASSCLISNAQFGPPGGRPGMAGPGANLFSGNMAKIFGEHRAFSANCEMETKSQMGLVGVPGKMAFLDGKTRFEMDTTKVRGANMPPGAAEQMKAMGMGEMVTINRPDRKESYVIYPGLKSYAAIAIQGTDKNAADSKMDIQKTEQGKETVDGHPTTKYKVVIKDENGKEHQLTLWSASDLKDFPVKIVTSTEAGPSTVTFKDVKFAKPAENLFEPPADFQKYDDIGAMMRETMMKRFAPPGGALPPPGKAPKTP